ncbi:Type IV secretory pathway, VirB4 component [Nostoc flagelliforme CCNUN1]|uniref:Type IV secretory pathway, VirB4 component n=1 Tax=Nostoc flagelliforme CCNUN1 TaxID=2038116 RepID=A0A2K8T3X4_9NOSO|nr:Type IV secretory pathway, VirB4 component [Nostoc flagelliforme CCNUN1]
MISQTQGLVETQTSDFHIRHHLLENEESVPFLDRQWVKIQDKYIGVMNFSQKPGGWIDERSQLRYLWELISKESISDTEIICQITKANQAITKTNLQRLTKQSITSTALSTSKGNIDVKAGINIEESVEAQRTIYKGSVVVYTGVAFLVHRKSTRELNQACKYLASYFLRPAAVDREKEYAWKTWLQCCPFVWEPLLAKPFNRRLPYFSSEAPGLMPLIRTGTGDRTGFELIAEEGGMALFQEGFESPTEANLLPTAFCLLPPSMELLFAIHPLQITLALMVLLSLLRHKLMDAQIPNIAKLLPFLH